MGFIFVGVYTLYWGARLNYVVSVCIVWQSGLCGAYLSTVLLSCALWGELMGSGCVHTLRDMPVCFVAYLWVVE